MEKEKDSELTRIINPIHDLAEGLRDEGYLPAGRMRISKPKKLAPDMIEILKKSEPIKKSFFGFEYNEKQKALHLGTIWVHNEEIGAIENKNWVLEVNNSPYASQLTKVVQNFSSSYGVKLKVIPSKSKPGRETYLHELY